jgi:hypothetical protein
VAHDLIRKPVPTFRDHAPARSTIAERKNGPKRGHFS